MMNTYVIKFILMSELQLDVVFSTYCVSLHIYVVHTPFMMSLN
jgi:hypothetical protein